MKPDYVIALCVYLAANAIRTGYEILKKGGKVNPKNPFLFMFIFVAMCLLWISYIYMCLHDPLYLTLPLVIHWIGIGIFAVGLVLAFGALIRLKGVENIDHLVTTGLFAKVRHPMYLGFVFWIFGWAIFCGAAASLIASSVGIGNIIYWAHLEEEHLQKTYGDKYLAYRKQTWF